MIYIGFFDTGELSVPDGALLGLPGSVREKISAKKDKNEKKLCTGAYLLLEKMYSKHYLNENTKEFSDNTEKATVLPEIVFSESGKPRFVKTEEHVEECETRQEQNKYPMPSFNISHSGSISAVVITDIYDSIGIDVQCEPRLRGTLERVAKRFFAPFRKGVTEGESVRNKGLVIEDEIEIEIYTVSDCSADGQLKITDTSSSDSLVIKCGAENKLPKKTDGDKNNPKEKTNSKSCGLSVKLISENDGENQLVQWTVLEALLKMQGDGFGAYTSVEKIMSDAKLKSGIINKGKDRYAFSIAVRERSN